MMLAILVIILGLYAVTFRNTAAAWAIGIDGKVARTNISEKVYTAGFTVVGAFFVTFGVLIVLLIA